MSGFLKPDIHCTKMLFNSNFFLELIICDVKPKLTLQLSSHDLSPHTVHVKQKIKCPACPFGLFWLLRLINKDLFESSEAGRCLFTSNAMSDQAPRKRAELLGQIVAKQRNDHAS